MHLNILELFLFMTASLIDLIFNCFWSMLIYRSSFVQVQLLQ